MYDVVQEVSIVLSRKLGYIVWQYLQEMVTEKNLFAIGDTSPPESITSLAGKHAS